MVRILAAIAVVLSIGFANPALAQTGTEYQREVDELATYTLQFKAITEDLYAVMDPTDQADAALAAFETGDITDVEALGIIQQARADVKQRALTLRAQFQAIGAPPEFKLIDKDVVVMTPEGFSDMLRSVEGLTNSLLDINVQLIEGDEDALAAQTDQILERARVLINIGNKLIESDLVSLGDMNHPQKAVLRSGINSNNVSLLIIEMQFARWSGDTDTVAAYLEELDDLRVLHKTYIAQGKADQDDLKAQLQIGLLSSRGSDRAFIRKVIGMVDAYDAAWVIENNFVEAIESYQAVTKTDKSDEDQMDVNDEIFLDALILAEDQRSAEIFARVELMSN